MSNERIKERNQWTKPEMTILVRNKPEEAVLGSCKASNVGSSPGNNDSSCVGIPSPCGPCEVPFGS